MYDLMNRNFGASDVSEGFIIFLHPPHSFLEAIFPKKFDEPSDRIFVFVVSKEFLQRLEKDLKLGKGELVEQFYLNLNFTSWVPPFWK